MAASFEPRAKTNEWAALAIAGLLHVAVLAVAPIVGSHVETTAAVTQAPVDAIDVELESNAGVEKPERAAATETEDDEATSHPSGAKSVARSIEVTKGEAESVQAKGEATPATPNGNAANEAPPSSPPGPPSSEGPANGNGGVVSLPGINAPVWGVPGVLAPLPAPLPAPTVVGAAPPVDRDIASKVIDGSLAKQDHDKGLDLPAAGTVASAVADAVRSSATPADSKATFEVRLGADGKVLGVRVVSTDGGDAGAWDRAAKAASGALAAKALAMRGEAAVHGAIVTVKVDSKQQYPWGNRKKSDVKPVCADQMLKQLADQVAAVAGDHGHVAPGSDVGVLSKAPTPIDQETSKFCIPIGISGSIDPSNIGAHLQTVVSSKFSVAIPGLKPLEDVKKVDQRAPWSPADPSTVRRSDYTKSKKKKKKDDK